MPIRLRLNRWQLRSDLIMALAVLALVLTSTAPAPVSAAQSPISREFVARLGGSSDSFAGIVVGQGRVLAYVCNGTDAGVSVYSWFQGDLTGAPTTLVAANGLELTFEDLGSEIVGEVRLTDGSVEAFTATAATGVAGLFRAEGTLDGRDFVGGRIVLDDGDIRGQVQLRPPTGAASSEPGRFVGTGGFNLQNGTAGITDGTSNTIVTPVRVTSEIIAILIG